jgi:hypothetical protein
MRYLPSESIADDFWRGLRPQIQELLQSENILRSRSQRLYPVYQLRELATDIVDENNNPLFRDIEPEMYIAVRYSWNDQTKLRPLGLRTINVDEFVARFRADLNSQNSRFKSPTTTPAWHSLLVDTLVRWFNNGWQVCNDIRRLEFIPLQDGS